MRRVVGAGLCCANQGISPVIRAIAGEREHVVLFDAGPVDHAVEHNGTRLGIDFGAIAPVVLSHGHWDHGGGLLKAFELTRAAAPGCTAPIYLHPGMFAERGQRQPDGGVLPSGLLPKPEDLANAGARPIVTDAPQLLLNAMLYPSGEIPRVTAYEVDLRNHVRRNANGDREADPLIMDERFLAVAVIGGFHLFGETERCISESVRDIASFDLTVIVPSHCTGWRALNSLVETCGKERVAPLAVGKIFAF